MLEQKTIHIAAAVMMDDKGRLLLVRKRGTVYFMQPGGKIEPGEDARSALIRELREELNLELSQEELTPLGEFTDSAANEPGYLLHACMFSMERRIQDVKPAAEIEEILWLSPSNISSNQLAPLTLNKIVPHVWPSIP
ncbi:NUDIX domain-containing protein [Apirhabdus apintestini]|uniref:NUDIX hydrolase n=1 Tax=Erwinia sp. HR93 TaxID=3094840 RepID=UPI002ADED8CB|nr:NUDIX domain-containing protein [Erwinia sp. HR93]MEA1065034.1 NUDIX domain-containing protein [Erwinia sp. HR93]WPM85769.1 NUDIX domain-containing protein [Enterobacteriaceae bacterium CA-0114]